MYRRHIFKKLESFVLIPDRGSYTVQNIFNFIKFLSILITAENEN